MCVIIVNEKGKRIDDGILISSSIINPHGLGVLWLDDYSLSFHNSDEYEVLQGYRPYIAHFRYATVGSVCEANCHPFDIDHEHVLFQNGTVEGLGSRDQTDTAHLAEILADIPKRRWREVLEMTDCRYIIANTKERKFEIFNREMWANRGGVLYSKTNVLDNTLLAVYGTLKMGNGNFNRFLSYDNYVESGDTVDKFPMIDRGIPYVLPWKGQGHNVEVDVFLVNNKELRDIDSLEGHPNWYKRERTLINLDNGKQITAWLYFNDTVVPGPEEEFIAAYKGGARSGGYAPSGYLGRSFYDDLWDDGYDYRNKPSYVEDDFDDDDDFDDYEIEYDPNTGEQRLVPIKNGVATKSTIVDCPSCGTQCMYDMWEDDHFCSCCGEYLNQM